MPQKKRNSFYFFMKEMQEKEAAKGRTVTMKTLPNLAHPIWAKMSLAEREPYEELARKHKNDPNLRGGKLQSDGKRVEDYLREAEEEEMKEVRMQSEIRTYLNVIVDPQTFREEAPRKLLYFMHFNIMCKTEATEEFPGEYFPNEIGIVEYSIEHGITRVFHKFINPGSPPTGYANAAKALTELHKIDYLNPQEGRERNMSTLFDDIKTFITDSEGDYQPIFCNEADIVQTRGCIKWIASRARERFIVGGQEIFRIWNAKYLILELKSGVNIPLPSFTIANDLITRTCFNYHPEASCEYHYNEDTHQCALGFSKRLCFLISDAVCSDFGVILTDKHIPVQRNENVVVVRSNNESSSRRHLASAPRLDQRENYYQNEAMQQEQFVNDQNGWRTQGARGFARPMPVAAATAAVPPPQQRPLTTRQPVTLCHAARLHKERIKPNAEALIPGMGRGQLRRN